MNFHNFLIPEALFTHSKQMKLRFYQLFGLLGDLLTWLLEIHTAKRSETVLQRTAIQALIFS